MWDWLTSWIEDRINIIKDWASGLFATVTYIWDTVVASVKSWALSTFAKLGEIASTVIKYITNVYETVSNYITNTFNTIANYISNVYETVSNNITNTYNTVTNNITNVIGVTIEKVGEWFTSIGGATRTWAEGLFVKSQGVWQTLTGDLGKWWKTQLALLNETFGWVLLFRSGIEDFFTDPLEWLVDKLEDWFWGKET